MQLIKIMLAIYFKGRIVGLYTKRRDTMNSPEYNKQEKDYERLEVKFYEMFDIKHDDEASVDDTAFNIASDIYDDDFAIKTIMLHFIFQVAANKESPTTLPIGLVSAINRALEPHCDDFVENYKEPYND